MPNDSAVIVDLNENDILEIEQDLNGCSITRMQFIKANAKEIFSSEYKDRRIFLFADTIGTSAQKTSTILIDNGIIKLREMSLVEGKLISNSDVTNNNRVAVIDVATAKILFGDGSAVGEELVVPGANNQYNSYTIIGVIENSFYTDHDIKSAKKELLDNKNGDTNNIYINTCIYIPKTVFETDFVDEEKSSALLLTDFEIDINEMEVVVRNSLKRNYSNNYVTKQSFRKDILEEISDYKRLFIILLVIVLLFSGANCMNIFFFSVKEEIPEIGIRKAFGASKYDIILQYILESLFLSIVSSVFAVFISCLVTIKTLPSLSNYFLIDLVFYVKIELFLFPVLATCLQGLFASILPSLYAASVDVVDALRFD